MGNLRFSDGMSFNTDGVLRTVERRDGWYVVGEGNLIPVKDEAEGLKFISEMKGQGISLEDLPKVVMTLVGLNGNAFNLMGHFHKNAERQGWPEQAIKQVLEECKSSDYDHLVQTLLKYTTEE